MRETIKPVGTYRWRVEDKETGEVLKSGACHNLVVNVGKNAIADAIGNGTTFQIDTMKVGTTDTAFTVASTDLTTEVASGTPTTTVTDNSIEYEYLFSFGSDLIIEETGLFDGTTALSLSNEITEDVTTTQALRIIWTITFS